jgi:hypothetical protein
VGFQAWLGRGNGGSGKPEAIQRDSDAKGTIDFGVVQPGDWEFRISRNLEDRSAWHAFGKLNVGLGKKIEKAIICPRIDSTQPTLTVQIDWPAELAGKNLAALALFHHKGFVYQPPIQWTLEWANRAVLLPEKGTPNDDIRMYGFYFWRLANSSETGMEASKSLAAGPYTPDQVYLEVQGLDRLQEPKSMPWHEGAYQLVTIAVVKTIKNLPPSFHGERCALLALAGHRFVNESAYALQQPPTDSINPMNGQIDFGPKPLAVLPIADSYWKDMESRLVVKSGQTNDWKIELPEELTKAVRAKPSTLPEK